MINDLQTDAQLDAWLRGFQTREQLDAYFQRNGVDDSDPYADAHVQAALAVERYNLVQQVQSVHTTWTKARKPAKVVPVKQVGSMSLRVAAAVLFLLGSFTLLQFMTSSHEQLYRQMHQPFTTDATRSEGGAGNYVEAFQQGDYPGVIRLYRQLEQPGVREMFLAANAYLETGDVASAVQIFQYILDNNAQQGGQLYEDETEYYLAMAYLKLGDKANAVRLLEKIASDSNHTYHRTVDKWMLFRLKWLGH
jgi:tetratricopeptide (TPR) repeat protein